MKPQVPRIVAFDIPKEYLEVLSEELLYRLRLGRRLNNH